MAQFNELLTVIISTVVPIFIIVGLTGIVGRYRQLDVHTLSRISIYLLSPALILVNISQSGLGPGELSHIVVAAMVVCGAMAIIASLIARRLHYSQALASSFILTAFIMNSVNFGLPYIEFAFGQAGLETAVVFTVGQVFMAYLVGTYVASRGRSSVGTAVRNVLTIPMPYAFALGLWLNATGRSLPSPVLQACEVLARGIIPVTLVVLGLQLSHAQLRGRWRSLLVAAVTRFGVGTAVAMGIAFLFGFQGLTRQVFIMEASMPAGVLSGVLSTEFGGDPEFAAATILVTTLGSTLYLSGLLLVLT
ncbi:MAG: AEC family transporter [Ardenticatenaceae bacterium]|nr:AEC family transporter [Ardenticatenaceae bacterium]